MLACIHRWQLMRQMKEVRKIVRGFRRDRKICETFPPEAAAFVGSHIALYRQDRSHYHPRALRLLDKEFDQWKKMISEMLYE